MQQISTSTSSVLGWVPGVSRTDVALCSWIFPSGVTWVPVILGWSFLLLWGLGPLPPTRLHSLACHQRIQGIEEEQKPGRYLKSEQWTLWYIFKYYFFNQQGHSHLFTCLHQGPVPWQPKQLFCQGENHLRRNKFLFALQKGGFTFCPRANIIQLKSSFTLFRINHRHPFSSSLPSFNFLWRLWWAKCFFQQKVSEEVYLQFQKRHSLEISFVESNCIPHPLL